MELNYPDTVEWSASVLDGGSLITTGNTWNGATQKVNIVTTKTDQGGSIVWQTEYNGTASGFDYGAALVKDGSGNIFVAGATHASDDYSFDIVVIKYNSSGVQQWATTFDGTGNANDIPSDIILVGSDIYVCAASIGSTTGYDYLLLKLNSGGTVQWNQRYDYTSLYDIPGHLATNGSNVVVSGASQSSATNWDYTSLKYNSSGTLVQTNRSSAAGYGFDRPTGLVTDVSDNFYITGYSYNGTDYDMRTIKLDDDLSPVWTISENDGAEDGSNAICIDGSNNIYIAGYAENTAYSKQMKIVKYNSSGTLQWEKILQNSSSDIHAQATGITYNATNNRVLITGYYTYPTGKKTITTFALNASTGNIAWKKEFPNLGESMDVPTNVLSNNNFIWVYGRRTVDDTVRYVTIKYETFDKLDEIEYDSLDIPYRIKNQIIVRFSPYSIKAEFAENSQKTFDILSNVLNTTTYNKIQPLLCNGAQCNPTAIKIFKKLTTADSVTTSRLGNIVKVEKLWSAILIFLPDSMDIEYIIDSLNNLEQDIIYAQTNNIYYKTDVPNDADWESQHSLFSTTFPDAHINAENGWDEYLEAGDPEIRVGVFDSGIDWIHEDFGDGSFTGSKIMGGFNYFSNTDTPDELLDEKGHGTFCAGIIGAIRNNGIGIAGIAGGNWDDLNNTGVSLYSMKIDNGTYATSEKICEAYVDGALIYHLDITSHSYGGPNFDLLLKDGLDLLYKCESIFVASRGNYPNPWDSELDDPMYPACFYSERVLNIGGNGTDGQWKTIGNGNFDDDVDNNIFQSMTNWGVDVIAPSTNALVLSTEANTNDYASFNGTSAAAPHVAGLVGLMLSFYGNNLVPEDIENIIESNCIDVNDTGHDMLSGHGRIDVESTLSELQQPQYQVVHITESSSDYSVEAVSYFQDILLQDYLGSLDPGTYAAEVYNITYSIDHSLSESAELLGSWVRNSNTTGYIENITGLGAIKLPAQNGSVKITINETEANIKTRLYKVTHKKLLTTYIDIDDKWLPCNPEDIVLNYSLHIFDPLATDIHLPAEDNTVIQINPNPTDRVITVKLQSEDKFFTYKIVGLDGKIWLDDFMLNNNNLIEEIDVSSLNPGLYMLFLTNTKSTLSRKFIKL